MKKFIIYGRKSKDRRDKDGNIATNQHTFSTQGYKINNYLKSVGEEGVDYVILGKFEEDITGAGYYTKRPIFNSLVSQCKEDKALTLLVSDADRLARNVRSGSELMETIDFIIATIPDADDSMKHMHFLFAEMEWKKTSDRYKATLAAKKSRGEPLGAACEKYKRNPNNATKRNREEARERTEWLVDRIKLLINALPKPTFKNLANALNEAEYPLPSGKVGTWRPVQVSRIIERFDIARVA